MKQLKISITVLFYFLFFTHLSLNAQTIIEVTPDNATASAQEIKDLFGSAISVSANDIKNFYLGHWSGAGGYSENCGAPDVDITDVNNVDVSFDWPNVPSASGYATRYLQLTNGDISTYPSLESHITIDIPNDIYLFTFQSKCSPFRSALYIIIIEKPIMMSFRSCQCPESDLVFQSYVGGNYYGLTSYTWDNMSPMEEYHCIVSFQNGPSGSFTTNITFGPDGPETVSINPSCMNNMIPNQSESLIQMHTPGNNSDILGLFNFSYNYNDPVNGDPQFTFITHNNNSLIGKIYLYKCREPAQRTKNAVSNEATMIESDNKISIVSLTNPTKGFAKVEYRLPSTEEISIALFDTYGKQISPLLNQQSISAGAHQLEVDLSNYSSGIYYCVLKTQQESIPVRLVKVE